MSEEDTNFYLSFKVVQGICFLPSLPLSAFIFEMHVQHLTIRSFCPSRDFDELLSLIYDVHSSNTKEKIYTTTIILSFLFAPQMQPCQRPNTLSFAQFYNSCQQFFRWMFFWSSSISRQCRIRVLLRIKGKQRQLFTAQHLPLFIRVVFIITRSMYTIFSVEIAFCLYFYHLSFYSAYFSVSCFYLLIFLKL